MLSEEWRSVEGWPYEVSNLGRVRNAVARTRTRVGHVRTPHPDNHGRLQVILKDAPRRRVFRIHQLVASAFLGPRPSPKHEVNHIDGDKLNNGAANLEWVTRSENIRHSFRLGMHTAPRAPRTRLTRRQLEWARWLVDEKKVSHVEAAETIGISAGHLCNLLNGKHVPEGLEGITRTGRRPRKVTQQQVDRARGLRASGARYRDIKAEVGISASHLCRILKGTAVPEGIR